MTEKDKADIASLIAESKTDTRVEVNPLKTIPVPPFAIYAVFLAIMGFLTSEYVSSFRGSDEKFESKIETLTLQVSEIQSAYNLISKDIEIMKGMLEVLGERSEKRYTSDDATKDLSVLERRLNGVDSELETIAKWRMENDAYYGSLEKSIEEMKGEITSLKALTGSG